MKRAWAIAGIIALAGTGASSCSSSSQKDGQACGDGGGHWIEDESGALKGGYTVIVRICVDDGGNIIDLEVD